MSRESITTYVTAERKKEMKQAAEEGGWSTIADYLRSMIRAGESNFAELDPRLMENGDSQQRRVPDSKLLNQLDGEFAHINEIIKDISNDFEDDMSHRLLQMSQDDASSVVTDGKGNYRIDK